MARSSPISRVRWATSIEKVLMIRKPPTSREIPAKPSMAYFMKSRKEPTPLVLSAFCSCAVFTWYPVPRALRASALSWSSLRLPSP